MPHASNCNERQQQIKNKETWTYLFLRLDKKHKTTANKIKQITVNPVPPKTKEKHLKHIQSSKEIKFDEIVFRLPTNDQNNNQQLIGREKPTSLTKTTHSLYDI